MTDACLLMGILDPGGFAGGEMRLDAERARAPRSRRSSTPLSLEQRVAFAYRIAVNNIAEEITNVAIRHGVDPRDFSLVAYGAAGPMLLPAALELLHVARDRDPAAPRAASRRSGLLSTDLVYSDSRSAYVVLSARRGAADRRGLRARWRRACASALGDADGRRGPAQLRRAPARPELGDAVRRGAGRPDRRATTIPG